MKRILFAIMGLALTVGAGAQSKLLKKAMSKYNSALGNGTGNMEFYADESLTQNIDKIEDGDFVFYAKANIDKNAAKLCDNYSRAVLEMRFDNDRNIYDDVVETGKPLVKTATDPGYISYKIDLMDSEKGDLVNISLSEAEEKRLYPLTFKISCPGKNKTLSTGEFQMDLSMGNDKYVGAFLSEFDDYSFTATDNFKDDALKNEVIEFYQTRDVEIVNFAWGERVPYTSDNGRENIRRHSAVVTYVDGENDKCFKAGMSMYDSAPYPSTNYKFDRASTALHNSTQIPCNRIGR